MVLVLAWLAPVVAYRLWRAVPRSRVNSAPPGVAAAPQAAPIPAEREPASSGSGTAYQLLAGVAGVLGTGIGGAAVLTFVGGMIFLARFRGAGISAPSAVPLVERERLLAVGADQLVAFLVAGAGLAFLVCLAYWLGRDQRARAAAGERVLLLLAAVAGVLYYLWWAPAVDSNPGWFLFLAALLVLAAGAAHDYRAGSRIKRPEVFRRRVVLVASVLVGGAYYLWKAPPLDQYPFEWGLGAALLVLMVGAILVDRIGSHLMEPVNGPLRDEAGLQRPGDVALALVAAVAFLTVAVYSVLATYARNLKDPLVNPAAVVVRAIPMPGGGEITGAEGSGSDLPTSSLRGIWGLYVGESDDHVYLAWTEMLPRENAEGEPLNPGREPLRHARLIGVRREAVVDVAIGGVVAPRSAGIIAPVLCRQLVDQVPDQLRPECIGRLKEKAKSGK
jgi:hypothetical protein